MKPRHATNRFGLAERPRQTADITPEQAAASARVDDHIAIFALGVILGWLLKTAGAA